jgi:hypothetical protein
VVKHRTRLGQAFLARELRFKDPRNRSHPKTFCAGLRSIAISHQYTRGRSPYATYNVANQGLLALTALCGFTRRGGDKCTSASLRASRLRRRPLATVGTRSAAEAPITPSRRRQVCPLCWNVSVLVTENAHTVLGSVCYPADCLQLPRLSEWSRRLSSIVLDSHDCLRPPLPRLSPTRAIIG